MRGFRIRHAVEEIRTFLGYYAAYSGNSLRRFRDTFSFPFSRVKKFGFLDP
jgi:hypothetical protein